jgi:hypothetical protein
MGYTHYYTQKKPFTHKDWHSFTEFVEKLTHYKPTICGPDGYERPIINESDVMFNGDGKDAHESFHVSRNICDGDDEKGIPKGFRFCKTLMKPYDTSVVASLIFLYNQNRSRFVFQSDGTTSNWHEGLYLCRAVYPHLDLTIPDLDEY